MDPALKYARRRRLRLIGWAAMLALAAAIVWAVLHRPDPMDLSTETVTSLGPAIWKSWLGNILNPFYVGLVLVLILAERFFTADEQGGTLTVGGANDLLWLVAYPLTGVTLVALWIGAVGAVYDEVSGATVIDLPDHIGLPAAIILAFVIGDFFNWFTHWARHKLPTFWYFHAVHHSQPQMGVLTDFRVHFMEPIIATTLVFVPSLLLGIEARIGALLAFSTLYFTAFTHANLRTNLGPLRYVLVTPQFHRIHHGYAPEHIDVNFATALSIWDRMFGTAYTADENEYCDTGIDDPDFPLTRDASPKEVAVSYLKQNVYPFRQCARDIKRYELGAGRPATSPEVPAV